MPRGLVCRLHRQSLQSTLVDDGGRTGRAVHEFEFASGDILALRKALIDLEAFELRVIVAVVRPQHPRTLRVGCRAEASRESGAITEARRGRIIGCLPRPSSAPPTPPAATRATACAPIRCPSRSSLRPEAGLLHAPYEV